MDAPIPIRTTVHRSEMPNWTGVRVVVTGPRELIDQIMILGREGFEVVKPPSPIMALRSVRGPSQRRLPPPAAE